MGKRQLFQKAFCKSPYFAYVPFQRGTVNFFLFLKEKRLQKRSHSDASVRVQTCGLIALPPIKCVALGLLDSEITVKMKISTLPKTNSF